MLRRLLHPLLLICLLYLMLAAAYAVRTPPWQAPDEPAHYNYVAQVASAGCCPIIAAGDWDSAYLDALKSSRFAPALLTDLGRVQYEDHQPPLYYLLLAPLYSLSGGSLLVMRLATAAMGMIVVTCTYAAARLVMPAHQGPALAAAALVAFLPQFIAISSSVNNDALSWALVALALVGCIRLLGEAPPRQRDHVLMGVIVGAALLTKVNALFLLGVVPLVIFVRWLRPAPGHARSWTGLAARWLAFLLPALLLASLWSVRNLSVYGVPDVLGLAAHDRVVVGQLRTGEYIAQVGAGEYWRSALTTTLQSFVGQLGWMALPLPWWANVVIGGVVAAAAAGWAWALFVRRSALTRRDSEHGLLMSVVMLLALAQYAYYNLEFVQFQGRYLYTGLLPFALFVGGGLYGLSAPERSGSPAWRQTLPLRLVVLLFPINLLLVWRVVPGLAP